LPRAVPRVRRVHRDERHGRRPRGNRARARHARRGGGADLHERERPAARRARVPSVLRAHARARQADLGASRARREDGRLPDRGRLEVRDLVDVRLAVRDERVPRAHGVLEDDGRAAESQDHHASRRRHGAVLRRTRRPGMGSARLAHEQRRLPLAAEGAQEAADRLFPRLLRGYGDVRLESGDRMRARVLRHRSHAVLVGRAVRSRKRSDVHPRDDSVHRRDGSLRRGSAQDLPSQRRTPARPRAIAPLMFETLEPLPPDAILGMMALYRADPDPRKIDLSVGVYQDEAGRTPILESVKRAERAVFENEDTKTYVASAGTAAFNRGVEGLLHGDAHPAVADGRVVTLQTPGGSGALCVAAHLIRRARPEARVHISEPSWPNHIPLLTLSGLEIATYPYYDQRAHRVDFERMVDAVEKIPAGDLLLLHACCHNPCGADLTRDQWQTLAELCERRGIVPFIDLAYQGFAEGLDEDAYGVRLMSERMPEVVVVSSCSKNFGLYRERVGSV